MPARAYDEATESGRSFVVCRRREQAGVRPAGITDYDSRRTGNGLLDTGSTPVYSIKTRSSELDEISSEEFGSFAFCFITFYEFWLCMIDLIQLCIQIDSYSGAVAEHRFLPFSVRRKELMGDHLA